MKAGDLVKTTLPVIGIGGVAIGLLLYRVNDDARETWMVKLTNGWECSYPAYQLEIVNESR